MRPVEYQCKVTSFKMLTPTVYETAFVTSEPMSFKAGQFVSVVIPGAGPKGRDLRRAYSIASAPQVRPVELCIKIVEEGPGSQFIYRLREGDTFRAFASYGDFLYQASASRHACFIATGTGIAPFRSMLFSEEFKNTPPLSAFCFLGVRTEDELLYTDELEKFPGLNFVKAVSQPKAEWDGYRGRVTDYLESQALPGKNFPWFETDFYLCGNGAMITEVKNFLLAKGVTKDSIHQEIYYK